MKFLIIGFFSCISHQSYDFIKKEDIIEEYKIDGIANHFSYYKDIMIGYGLHKLGNEIAFLFGELKNSIRHEGITYLCNNDLTNKSLYNYDAVIFTKHNTGVIDFVLNKNEHLKELFIRKGEVKKTKLFKPYLVCKTCVLPTIDFIKKNIKKGLGEIFDYFFLQTDEVELNNSIIKSIVGIKESYIYRKEKDYLKIKNFNNRYENNRIHYSELFIPNNINFSKKCPFKKTAKYVLCYIGRIRHNNGTTIPFLMKLMSKLGSDYQLIILPGSFNLPNEKPSLKHNPKKENHYAKFKKYLENKTINVHKEYLKNEVHKTDFMCKEKLDFNITLLKPVKWGEQFSYLYHCDIAINFAPFRKLNYVCDVANTKIFDYLVSGVPIISEYGCQNNYLINKYNAGVVIDSIGSINDYYEGIKKIINTKYNKEDIINKVKNNENYFCRAQKINNILNT